MKNRIMSSSSLPFLAEAYHSEIAGEWMFRVLARLTRNTGQRHCWQGLVSLERQTQGLLLEHAAGVRYSCTRRIGARLLGGLYGLALGMLPSTTAMEILAKAAAPFLEDYTRFAQHCHRDDHWLAAYLRDHEQAILDCTEWVRQGDWIAAIAVIDRLILCHLNQVIAKPL